MGNSAPITPAEFDLVIDSLKNGISIMQLVRDMREMGIDFPSASRIYDHVYRSSETRLLYTQARETFAHAVVDEVINIADSERDPQRARNKMNARQWVAAKLIPKTYGDKLDLEVTNKVDLTVAVKAARDRLSNMRDNQLIDITPQLPITTTDIKSVVSDEEVDPFS